MLGGETADRVAGFWRALGGEPPAEPDHLAALLGLYVGLVELGVRGRRRPPRRLLQRARAALLWEHLLSWVPMFLRAVAGAGSPFSRNGRRCWERALIAEAVAIAHPDVRTASAGGAWPAGGRRGRQVRAGVVARCARHDSHPRATSRAARERRLGLRGGAGPRAPIGAGAGRRLDAGWLAVEADRRSAHGRREESGWDPSPGSGGPGRRNRRGVPIAARRQEVLVDA